MLVRFFACPFSWGERPYMSKEAAEAAVSTVVRLCEWARYIFAKK